ncbi:MAG: MCE family protein [Marmoricola sp.]
MLSRINTRVLVAAALVVVLVAAYLAFTGGSNVRTVSADFPQAVSIYKGSDVDVMGVRIGRVTAVVPEGDRVRVDMEYDPQYHLPANVKAAIITPTLVADRFVQLAPAYGGGPAMRDGGTIPLDRTAVPVELDQIYKSLAGLTKALGPNGANRNGALGHLLKVAAHTLRGNGKLGHDMIANLSRAAQVLGGNSGRLFGTVDHLAKFSQTLRANDRFVGSFLNHLSDVSTELSGERGDLRRALVALSRAVGTVRSFVHDNRSALVGDVSQLTRVLQVLSQQRQTLGKVLQLAPLGMTNLAEAGDPQSGTVGIRLQLGPMAQSLGNVLCDTLKNDGMQGASLTTACKLFKVLLPGNTDVGAGQQSTSGPRLGSSAPAGNLGGLLGPTTGGRS